MLGISLETIQKELQESVNSYKYFYFQTQICPEIAPLARKAGRCELQFRLVPKSDSSREDCIRQSKIAREELHQKIYDVISDEHPEVVKRLTSAMAKANYFLECYNADCYDDNDVHAIRKTLNNFQENFLPA